MIQYPPASILSSSRLVISSGTVPGYAVRILILYTVLELEAVKIK
jgi:hypothetical protein